jgi:hypothetical protein
MDDWGEENGIQVNQVFLGRQGFSGPHPNYDS